MYDMIQDIPFPVGAVSITRNLRLRLAEVNDAEFILGLRLDETKGRYLSVVTNDIEKQRQWLRDYKSRESQRQEFYFVIESLNSEALGTVRIYDFQGDSFCWGSWILKDGVPASSAIESALSAYTFGFEMLRFSSCHFDVRKGNLAVARFHLQMGAVKTGETDIDDLFCMSKDAFVSIRNRYACFLKVIHNSQYAAKASA